MNNLAYQEEEGFRPVLRYAVRCLTPLIKIFLRFGLTVPQMEELMRKLAVDITARDPEFTSRKKAFTVEVASRTGLSRKEVTKQRGVSLSSLIDNMETSPKGNRCTRVLNAWCNDPRFHDEDGKPRQVLPLRSRAGVSFFQLAKEFGGDATTMSILKQLECSEAVRVEGNFVHLLNPYFVPAAGSVERAENITAMIQDMINTSSYNLRDDALDSRVQRDFFQRLIPVDRVKEAEDLVRQRSMVFGQELDEALSLLAHGRPRAREIYVRVGVGVYLIHDEGAIEEM